MEPQTHWIRDNGTILNATTNLFADESGNLLVDELGSNLQDSQSSDGLDQTTVWEDTL